MAGKIFINYRRDDSAAHALNIAQYLERTFGSRSVFIDVDRLRAGQMFPQVLDQRLAQSDVMLTVIGPAWLDIRKDDGTRRIDDAEDWVRMEIERALTRGVTVIPITVAGAKLPSQERLPETLKPLVHRHAVNLTTNGFRAEMAALVQDLKSHRSSFSRLAVAAVVVLAIALAATGYLYRADVISAVNRFAGMILAPSGPSPEEIKAKQEQAEAEAQRQRELEVKREEQAEQSAYAVARSVDTAAAWRAYLEAHPQSIHASAATSRLGELREIDDAKRKAAEEAQRRAADEQARAEAKQAALQVFDGIWTVTVCPQSRGCGITKCSPPYTIVIRDRQIAESRGWTSGLPAPITDSGNFRFSANNGVRYSGTFSGDKGTGKFSKPETSDSYGCSGSLAFQRAK